MIILYEIILYFLILLSFSLRWCTAHFGNISMSEIIFTLNMPLKGTPNEYFYAYFTEAFLASVAGYMGLWLIRLVLLRVSAKLPAFDIYLRLRLFRIKKEKILHTAKITQRFSRRGWLLPTAWLLVLIIIANINYQLFDYLKSSVQTSDFIENEFVDIRKINIQFPEEKKNLICIFVESAETTFQDKENGGVFDENIIPEMTAIARENISFSQSDLLDGAAVAPGTGWTIAGLVAQTAGIPLKVYTRGDNRLGNFEYFLPGAVNIGEVLADQGYHNFFIAGSKFSYGGREEYFTQHGNYEIWDYLSAIEDGKIPEDYYINWGFEDQKLYTFAKEKLLDLAKEEQPFNFSMLTVDTHANSGDNAVCDLCPDKFEDTYANVWSCASRQLADFISWLQQQDFYDDTVICISGDHSSMESDFVNGFEYDKYNGSTNRNVYNVFINSAVDPVETKNRKFTTMDFFPSILAALGADIEGNRIGLGTNLFSEELTLPEKYGYEEMFKEMSKKSPFYDREILFP